MQYKVILSVFAGKSEEHLYASWYK